MVEEAAEKQEPPAALVTHLYNILHSTFPNVGVYINTTIRKLTTQMDCMRTSLTIPTISKGPFLNTRELCTAKGTIMKEFLMTLWNLLCLNLFSQGA